MDTLKYPHTERPSCLNCIKSDDSNHSFKSLLRTNDIHAQAKLTTLLHIPHTRTQIPTVAMK